MIKLYKSLSVFVFRIALISLLLLSSAGSARALDSCNGVLAGMGVMLPQYTSGMTHTIQIDMSSEYNPDLDYYLKVKNTYNTDDEAQTGSFRIDSNRTYDFGHGTLTVRNEVVTWEVSRKEALESSPLSGDPDPHFVRLFAHQGGSNRYCDLGTYQTTKNNARGQCALYVSQERDSQTCYSSGCMDTSVSTAKIEVEGLEDADGNPFNGAIEFVIVQIGAGGSLDPNETAVNGKASTVFNTDQDTKYEIQVQELRAGRNFDFPGCSTTVNVQNYCESCDLVKTDVSNNNIIRDFELCEQIVDPDERGECDECFSGSSSGGDGGVWTAIGCIPAKPESIIKTFITMGLNIGGGMALLLILSGAFRMSVSQGDPQATKEAKETITAAVIGLIFIIFSITMLRFIGVNLFQIPGFGE